MVKIQTDNRNKKVIVHLLLFPTHSVGHKLVTTPCPELKTLQENVFMKDPKMAILGVSPLGINGRGKNFVQQILLTAAL